MWRVCKDGQDESPSCEDKMCKDATKRQKKQAVAKQREQMKKDLVFEVGGKPIKILETLKHLGRVAAKNHNDEEAAKQSPGRSREKWASMQRFLIQDDVRPKKMAVLHRTVALRALLHCHSLNGIGICERSNELSRLVQ